MSNYCCPEFAEHTTAEWPDHPPFKFEHEKWNIVGCCGHCFVVNDMKFCPFCGADLKIASPNIAT